MTAEQTEYSRSPDDSRPEWPRVESEELEWRSRIATSGVPASRQAHLSARYHASIPALIADLDLHLPGPLAAYAEDATESLIRFDSGLGGEIAPFAALLLRSEAVASSQIEHLTASARQILTAELGVKAKANATMIAANTRAMRSALALSDELTPDTVLAMHAVLMEEDAHHDAGAFRREPVWIGTDATSPVGATFVAPSFPRVPGLVDDVMEYARRNDQPRLAQAAVTHAQFETIHPFTDGNGRTGRALIQSMLRGKGLTRNVTVPVSAGLLTDTPAYHQALTDYRDGDVAPIVRLAADATFLAIDNAQHLVSDVNAVRESWNGRLKVRRESMMSRVLAFVARQPVLNATVLASHLGVPTTNVYRYVNALVDAGVLKSKQEYQGGTVYRNDEILAALDAFAARSGRRG
jgi:Fic family protein